MKNLKGRHTISLTKEQIIEATKSVLEREGKIILGKVAETLKVSYPIFLREKERLGLEPKRMELTKRKKAFERIDWTEKIFLDEMRKMDDGTEKTIGYNEFKIKFDESIIILPIGDTHIGARTTEHYNFAKLMVKIKNLSNTKVILLGDIIDNFAKFSVGGGIHQQIVSVSKQKEIAEWICKYLGDKILAIIQGDHEEWSYTSDGFDLSRYLANKSGAVYLGKRGLLTLEVGENEYPVYCDHNSRWWSTDNTCHGLKQTCRKQVEFALGLGAHRHVPNAENSLIRGKMVKTCRVSSWKHPDRFIEKIKTPDAPILTQCYVLLAEKIEPSYLGMVYFETLDHALRFL